MQLIILTGMSGAGKTQALKKFEDSGYFCVDNLPCEMCVGLVELCKRATPPVEKAAVVMDSRERIFRLNMKNTLGRLDEAGVDYRIVFLDCRDEILERRYNETRRRHPLSDDISTGIRMEREMLAELRDRASVIIDTTNMRPLELGTALERELNMGSTGFMLRVMSFGGRLSRPALSRMNSISKSCCAAAAAALFILASSKFCWRFIWLLTLRITRASSKAMVLFMAPIRVMKSETSSPSLRYTI